MEEKATPDGKTLNELAENVVRERTITPRVGLFSDMVDGRPCICTYISESIINGRGSPAKMVVLEEKTEVPAQDRFRSDLETSYRELYMDGDRYGLIRHIPTTENAVFVEEEIAQGLQEGAIPFVFVGAQNLDCEDNTFIPLWPLAKKLLKAYEISPDYYQAMHYTAQPILFLRGFGDQVPSVAGATTTIGSDVDNADAKYVEFEGKGVGAMLTAIERQISEAMLFTHYLQDKGSSVESGEALGIRVGSQTATLKSVITNTAAALEQSLKYCAQWINADPDEVKVTPNLEFTDADIDSAILKVLGDQVALGVVPIEVYQAYQRQIKLTDLVDEDIAKLLKKQNEEAEAKAARMAQAAFDDQADDFEEEELDS